MVEQSAHNRQDACSNHVRSISVMYGARHDTQNIKQKDEDRLNERDILFMICSYFLGTLKSGGQTTYNILAQSVILKDITN